MKVSIIGSGNVATVLGKKILLAGHEIIQVTGRSVSNARILATTLKSIASGNIKDIDTNADLYLLCINDNSIKDVAAQLPFSNKLVVHTAGAVSKELLNWSEMYGVIYPLQSLRKDMDQMPDIPVMIDGNSTEVSKILFDFSSGWATSVSFSTDEERLKLHVAAVIASNFVNHLYTLSEEFCKKENVDFKHLLPLINETASRLQRASPVDLQTGPAIRKDSKTIAKHMDILSPYPALQRLYSYLSENIQKQHEADAT